MTDWRYWITYTGRVTAVEQKDAEQIALATHLEHGALAIDVEVEEVGEGE